MGTNGKINELSNLVVNKYIENGVPLNETISKLARQENYNDNYISRLVESANKNTFLRIFPEKHSFDVASVDGVKTLLGVTEKEAREKEPEVGHERNTNYKLLDICREPLTEKQSAATNPRTRNLDIVKGKIKRAIEELELSGRNKRSEMLGCEQKLADITKQAMLRGATFSELETYTLSTLNNIQKQALEVMNRVHEKVKNDQFVKKQASARGNCVPTLVCGPSIYTELVERITKCAYEELPVIQNGINVLRSKLGEIGNG